MSKQLAFSAAVSVFAMVAFVLSATSRGSLDLPAAGMLTGADAFASAPALGRLMPALSVIAD